MKPLMLTATLLFALLGATRAERNDQLIVAEQTLNDLYNAFGHFYQPIPLVKISEQTLQGGAQYRPLSNTIVLDEKVFDICSQFGPDSLNALAFILGHELAHAFQNSGEQKVVTNFLAFDKAPGADYHSEKAADIQGLFGAYLANYRSDLVFREVIRQLYAAYGLNKKKLEGYPPFEERLETVKEVEQIIDELISLYEISNYLVAMGEYQFAKASYSYITSYFQSAELLNNFGVNCLLWAMNLSDKSPDLFVLPLELDWNSRINKPWSRGLEQLTPEEIESRQLYIDLAGESFARALALDPENPMILLNTLCAEGAKGRWKEVATKTEAYIISFSEPFNDKFRLLKAVALANSPDAGERSAAALIFERLSAHSNTGISAQAQTNKKVLEQGLLERTGSYLNKEKTDSLSFFISARVDQVVLNRYCYQVESALDEENGYFREHHDHSEVFNFLSDKGRSLVLQRIWKEPVSADLFQQMKDCRSMQLSGERTLFLCKNVQIGGLVKGRGELVEWIKYHINE